jgi:hypothetical protein
MTMGPIGYGTENISSAADIRDGIQDVVCATLKIEREVKPIVVRGRVIKLVKFIKEKQVHWNITEHVMDEIKKLEVTSHGRYIVTGSNLLEFDAGSGKYRKQISLASAVEQETWEPRYCAEYKPKGTQEVADNQTDSALAAEYLS